MQYKIDYVVKDARDNLNNHSVNINAEQDIEVLVNCKVFLDEMFEQNNTKNLQYPVYFYSIKKINKNGKILAEGESLEKMLKDFVLSYQVNEDDRKKIVDKFLNRESTKVSSYCER